MFALAAVLIWAGFILVSRQGGISPLSPYDVIVIRYVTASVVLVPVWLIWQRFNIFEPRFLLIGLVGGVAYALLAFNGFELAPASHAAILLPGCLPLMIVLLNIVLNHERYPLSKWFGICLISIGICLLLVGEIGHDAGSSGHVQLVGAAFCWSIFSVLIKRLDIQPWQATISIAFTSCAVYLPIYLLFLPSAISVNLLDQVSLQAFYQGILATILQMLCYVKAVQLIGSARMGAMMAMVPILAGFSAVWVFEELMTSSLIVALILVSAGVWMTNTSMAVGGRLKQLITTPTQLPTNMK